MWKKLFFDWIAFRKQQEHSFSYVTIHKCSYKYTESKIHNNNSRMKRSKNVKFSQFFWSRNNFRRITHNRLTLWHWWWWLSQSQYMSSAGAGTERGLMCGHHQVSAHQPGAVTGSRQVTMLVLLSSSYQVNTGQLSKFICFVYLYILTRGKVHQIKQ